ncbi:NAD(P)-dependent alcohol dehydrogenase [Lichenibacterium minor]|uniref:NAD(P)-dependent alcohol dehydrogenase n=1 Tax=Lichenibacterium minor TaxID=2316528 RepID=A0A4V1RUD1_9HYPH|nr:NAD(P)-dependent alcohol dehydrogenase [Lichenibacterium minor]RYC30734.1 NAD(P)-dependent alcohol dehydrogenase [Lichenibacterium minor]
MKAMRLRSPGGLDNLQPFDLEAARDPGPGEIRVRLHASSLNYHDYGVASRPGWKADGRIPMSDGAGTVEAVGAGVAGFAAGDSVVSCFFPTWEDGPATLSDFATVPGDGVDGYAREAFTGPASCFTLAPKGYSHAEAATLTTAGLTAWRALVVDGGIKAGDSVLVLGTGGVSIFALQFAKAMGATVIATSSSDEKLDRARALGADATVNYKTHPEWGARVRDATGGRGVDHVIEVGGPGTLPQSIAAVRVGGHIALIGVLTGRGGEVPTGAFMLKQARLQGLIVGSRREQRDMVRGIDAMGVKPVIDRTYPLDGLADAFRHQESGAHFGKICLEF